MLELIPSKLFDNLLNFYIERKIPYINVDGTLSSIFLITEKEFKEKYCMDFNDILKEKVNTL